MDPINAICDRNTDSYERLMFVSQVRKWAGLNSDALLDSTCITFSIPSIQGFIGYHIHANCAIVFGDPTCDKKDQPNLAKAFQFYCEQHRLNVLYVIITDAFAKEAMHNYGNVLLQFGDKLILDPTMDPLKKTGPKGVLVRKKVKHAIRDGVTIHEYLGSDPLLEETLSEIGNKWLDLRHGPQIHIAHLDFFNDRKGKRWFYAKHKSEVVGFLILNEVKAESGWLLNNLILSDASPGTSELLVVSILEILKKEGAKRVIIGPVTSKDSIRTFGLGSFYSWLITKLFKLLKKVFNLDGQATFWEKFEPLREPSYILFDKINFRTIKALLLAMNVKLMK